MVFSSAIFLFYFFPVFVLLYLLAPVRWKDWVALMGSLVFYAWGAPTFVYVLLGAILLDFWLAKSLHRSTNLTTRKRLLTMSLLVNVGLLAYFKYANFFIDNVNALLTSWEMEAISWTAVVLPIGISFFTFQKISYMLDVYRGSCPPLRSLGRYALYILLFPQLIAGPIVRYRDIADQLLDRKAQLIAPFFMAGMFRFFIGLSKKLLIANPLGRNVDMALATDIAQMGTGTSWIVMIAYAFQIYFDFSGYSDMAIGLGQMMGFRFPENFRFPYLSASITEFWRRWHITLSQWMRDYLYIPLGGNRISPGRTYVNLWLVFLISGLWHGASWNFVIWGIWHGGFLVLERLFLGKWLSKIGRLPSMLLSFVVVVIGWVWFRIEELPEAWLYLQQMWGAGGGVERWFHPYFWYIFGIAAIICFLPIIPSLEEKLEALYETRKSSGGILIQAILIVCLMILCWSEIAVSGFNPFIYFRF